MRWACSNHSANGSIIADNLMLSCPLDQRSFTGWLLFMEGCFHGLKLAKLKKKNQQKKPTMLN